ncbi:MAG TPA: IS481 family transposase [Anaerolineae bacterium]|jgi:transposase InsO family protein|nr:IS481 family transposase [Anaerolineae bacterium]
MPWKGVTVSEQRLRFLEDYRLNFYSVSDLAERFGISRRTAHKWIDRFEQSGLDGYHELSRRPHSSPLQVDPAIVQEIVDLRQAHAHWGPAILLDLLEKRHPKAHLPSVSTAARILARHGLVRPRRRYRRAHPGCPKTVPQGPNDIWGADYKGQFRLGNGSYCFPLTVSDLASRFLLGVDAHPEISLDRTRQYFSGLFEAYGLPNRIRTDNGVPFASSALARLSKLSVWFIKLGIYPELIEPGRPQQNAVHERMHRTLKQDATIPPGASLPAQQRKFDHFRHEFNELRPHQSLGMKRPAEAYHPSPRPLPERIQPYDYPSYFLVRRVSRDGTIRVFSNQIFVSNTLQEDYVGLEEVADGVYDMYFCFYQIGRYLLHDNKIEDIVSRVAVRRRQIDLARRLLPMS